MTKLPSGEPFWKKRRTVVEAVFSDDDEEEVDTVKDVPVEGVEERGVRLKEEGVGLAGVEKWLRAFEKCREAARIRTADFELREMMAQILMEMSAYPDAVAYARAAITLSPSYVHAHLTLGRALLNNGDFSDSIASLKHGLTLSPIESVRKDFESDLAYAGKLLDAEGVGGDRRELRDATVMRPEKGERV